MKPIHVKLFAIHFVLLAGLLVGGCRREDIRVCDIEIKGMTTENVIQMKKVTGALERYAGVRKDSYSWHMADNGNLVLSLKYDSMQIAQTNLRMATAETGANVVFPENNRNGKAGYVDLKPASVE